MSSVDVKVLEEMVSVWRDRANAEGHDGSPEIAIDGCADDLDDAIAEASSTEDAPKPLAGVVVGPWSDTLYGTVCSAIGTGGSDPRVGCVTSLGDWYVYRPEAGSGVLERGRCWPMGEAKAAVTAKLIVLGATLEEGPGPGLLGKIKVYPETPGDTVQSVEGGVSCDSCSDTGWYQFTGPNGHGDPEPCDACEACDDDERKRWEDMTGNGEPDPEQDASSCIEGTSDPDHRVIRRDDEAIGVIDARQVEALHPEVHRGEVVTMVHMRSGSELPYRLSVEDLAWQLGIGAEPVEDDPTATGVYTLTKTFRDGLLSTPCGESLADAMDEAKKAMAEAGPLHAWTEAHDSQGWRWTAPGLFVSITFAAYQ